MNARIMIGLLMAIQISSILLTTQFLIPTNQSSGTITFVQQGIQQIPSNGISQNERFDSIHDNEKSPEISGMDSFILINSISSVIMILGVTKLLKIENRKKIQTEKLVMVGELSSRIAHDMRNPLSVIQMTLENFKIQYVLNEEQEKQFEKIHRAISRITYQIDDIWDFIKSPTVEKKNHSLASLLHDSIKKTNIPANIKIHLPLDDCEIFCDDEKTVVVFVNIFTNAIQAFKNDGNIWVSFDSNKKWIVVNIEDDGVGISPQILDKIFEPLVTTKQTGTGLGLSCCKSIMESQGGFIKVLNKPKKGCVFSIHFSK